MSRRDGEIPNVHDGTAAPRRRWWQLLWSPSYLRERIAELDDEKLVALREGVYRNPRGIKGSHLRMLTDECARRGL